MSPCGRLGGNFAVETGGGLPWRPSDSSDDCDAWQPRLVSRNREFQQEPTDGGGTSHNGRKWSTGEVCPIVLWHVTLRWRA